MMCLIEEQRLDHMKKDFDIKNLITYFFFYFIVEIKFLPYRFTCIDDFVPGFCCCKLEFFNGEMCCSARICKYFYYFAWLFYLGSYGELLIYWALWDGKSFAAYVIGDIFITISFIISYKLVNSLNHLKFMLILLITSLMCYAFFMFEYILICGYDFSLDTLRRLIIGGSIFIEGDVINEIEPYNFRIIFPYYTLVKGFMIYFYYYVFYEYYEGKNNYASSLLMIMVPGYGLSIFVKLLIIFTVIIIGLIIGGMNGAVGPQQGTYYVRVVGPAP